MKKHGKPFSVLVLGDEINLFVFVTHCLSQVKNIDIYILSKNKDTETRYSRKIKKYIYYPSAIDETQWISNIDYEVDKYQIDVIMPINELEIEVLIKNKNHLKNKDKLVLLPSLETFYKANHKGLLADHLKKHQIATPKSFLVKSGEKLNCKQNLSFPVLAKPTLGFYGGNGILKFNEIEELKSYFDNSIFAYDYLIEEYIDGYDLCCNILCKQGKILAFTIQKGVLWTNKPFTPQIGLEFTYNQELFNSVKKLMQTLNWSGVANIDIRFDKKSKQYMILEINPRFWLSTEASEMAGVNFPYLLCLSSLDMDFEMPNYKHVRTLSLKGLSQKVKTHKLFFLKLKFICNNTPIRYYVTDPMPLVYIMLNKIKSKLKSKTDF